MAGRTTGAATAKATDKVATIIENIDEAWARNYVLDCLANNGKPQKSDHQLVMQYVKVTRGQSPDTLILNFKGKKFEMAFANL